MYAICKAHFDGGRLFPALPSFSTPCNIPLPLQTYPHFTDYPACIENEKDQIERLCATETRLTDFKTKVREIEQVTQKMRLEEEGFRTQQEELFATAAERQKLLDAEEKNLMRERKLADEQMFQRRLEAIKTIQHSTRSSLIQQRETQLRENERMGDEIGRRMKEKEYELQARMKEESLVNMELEAHTQLSSLMRHRRQEENVRALRQHVTETHKEQELKEEEERRNWRLEDEQQRVRLEKLKQQKLQELADSSDTNHRREILMQLRLATLERQIAFASVRRERALRRVEAEMEEKEMEAELVRQKNAEFRVEADRRDHEATLRLLENDLEKSANHGLMAEVRRYGSEVDAQKREFEQQREKHLNTAFEEQFARLREDIENERKADEDSIHDVLTRMDLSRKNMGTDFSFEVREQELMRLIEQREAELAHLLEDFRRNSGAGA